MPDQKQRQPRPRGVKNAASTGAADFAAGGAAIDWKAQLAEHRPWLRRVVHARVGEPQAVDEVLQEVSLAAVRQKAPIHDPTKVAPWLYRLAVIQSLLYRRKAGRRRKLTERYADRVRPVESDERRHDPLNWLLDEERKERVRQALDALSRRDREILLLKYGEDWSYQQIAEHLGAGVSAVQARLHRARRRLRDILTRNELGGAHE